MLFDGREYRWDGNTAIWANATSGNSSAGKDNIIEFVTSPNNPDALLRKPVVRGASAVVDHAYYWPHFTHIPAPADEDVMLFTISKVSGHASSRFGYAQNTSMISQLHTRLKMHDCTGVCVLHRWALIRDEKVAKRADTYIQQSTLGGSRDTQLRMLKIIKLMLANLHGEEDIFRFGHDVMRAKWQKLNAVVSRSRRFSLQTIPPQYCTYFNKTREPSPGDHSTAHLHAETFRFFLNRSGKLSPVGMLMFNLAWACSLCMGEVREGGGL